MTRDHQLTEHDCVALVHGFAGAEGTRVFTDDMAGAFADQGLEFMLAFQECAQVHVAQGRDAEVSRRRFTLRPPFVVFGIDQSAPSTGIEDDHHRPGRQGRGIGLQGCGSQSRARDPPHPPPRSFDP